MIEQSNDVLIEILKKELNLCSDVFYKIQTYDLIELQKHYSNLKCNKDNTFSYLAIESIISNINDTITSIQSILKYNDISRKKHYISFFNSLLKEEIKEKKKQKKELEETENYLTEIENDTKLLIEKEYKSYVKQMGLNDDFYNEYVNFFHWSCVLKKERTIENFKMFLNARKKGAISLANTKDYTKFDMIGINPNLLLKKISKRQLPTEVFKYLIVNSILKPNEFEYFLKNNFGRTFESKMGDIILEKDYPKESHRQKRYNKLDFNQINSNGLFSFVENKENRFNKILYVSNQWDKNSIEKFINFINAKFAKNITITKSNEQGE